MYKEFAEIISIFLTFPSIFLILLVLIVWSKGALISIRNKTKTAPEWLILGICFSFLGAFISTSYWGFLISVDYFYQNEPFTKEMLSYSIYVDMFSRQILGIIAAYCHLRSFFETSKSFKSIMSTRFWVSSSFIASVYIYVLNLFKNPNH